MKTSLAHLPEQKQQALALLVEKLQEAYPMGIRSIILFGSHARGTWVEEKAPDGVRYAYQSDFDVFIVTDTAQRAARIEGDIPLSNRLSVILRTPVSIIAHDGLFFNRRLRKAQYFFADIKKEGICLFDDSSFELAEAKELSPKERQHLAQESFDYWFQSAEEFYKGFNFYLKSGFLSKAAFSLHQVVECHDTACLYEL